MYAFRKQTNLFRTTVNNFSILKRKTNILVLWLRYGGNFQQKCYYNILKQHSFFNESFVVFKPKDYAASNNSFYIGRDSVVLEFKADKQPCGYYPEQKPFTLRIVNFQKMRFCLFF